MDRGRRIDPQYLNSFLDPNHTSERTTEMSTRILNWLVKSQSLLESKGEISMLFTVVTTLKRIHTPVVGGRRLAQHPDRAKRQTSSNADAGYPRSMVLCSPTECIAQTQERIWNPSSTFFDDPPTLTTWKLNHRFTTLNLRFLSQLALTS
jgi:hypothetical protein